MIGSSKNNRENYPRKYFWAQEKETRFKFNLGLSANQPSNNWRTVSNALTLALSTRSAIRVRAKHRPPRSSIWTPGTGYSDLSKINPQCSLSLPYAQLEKIPGWRLNQAFQDRFGVNEDLNGGSTCRLKFLYFVGCWLKSSSNQSISISIIYLPTLTSMSTSARSKYERALNLQL